ncbi:MAG TPA: phosphoribosylformylglycinamidine cyclo-ligase [Herpetosiphon sp.]|uniref:Phosphoribosylformylglycinamidine cyclo-ligase n=1 Tax=Herpetosiphon aurantiacus (strain ATCC 23779 / DSM 785 / 114-95) TaxID=316274 RepID=A9B322_HERA2|nr:phosphoribosylformylglycinamidine cyclo-ligase [Herpetosiphon sp.]ABX07485.1 phosphoribosylformylglycinamidine cyclo-ligase [Herpetosiphon aurantiacus DSM 785]HBW49171.1 phosphoribosylformylglycinamidine cyclo-ligase [Herpetosiphon sp.]
MTTYKDAGVDIATKMDAIQQMGAAVKATHTPAVLAGLGAFGGCFDLAQVNASHAQPVLVASTDGVGTKTAVAAAVGDVRTIGADLVNHCINDILCQGATPLFFLDYIAASKLEPAMVVAAVEGLAAACRDAGIALLGGETAEMPGVYHDGAFDVAGTIVGVVDRAHMLDGSAIKPGDVAIALPSTGLHTNGYSLARKVCAPLGYASQPTILAGLSIGEALLAPHRAYLHEVQALRQADVAIHGLAHITGGGIWDNIPRVLPANVTVELVRGSWQVPAIFKLIVEQAAMDEHEAHHVLNMGLGMILFIAAEQAEQALATISDAQLVGRVIEQINQPRVVLVDH